MISLNGRESSSCQQPASCLGRVRKGIAAAESGKINDIFKNLRVSQVKKPKHRVRTRATVFIDDNTLCGAVFAGDLVQCQPLCDTNCKQLIRLDNFTSSNANNSVAGVIVERG